jgi:hypothetical protein
VKTPRFDFAVLRKGTDLSVPWLAAVQGGLRPQMSNRGKAFRP